MSGPSHKIFIVGGTGAQGLPVVESLVRDGKYSCRILTRDINSTRAQGLLALGNENRNPSEVNPVELVQGSFGNETDLRNGFRGCTGAFINIDGFNCGEKTETYWAIRSYELALEDGGIEFFVYGNLDYIYKLSGYDSSFRTGHYDGKGRIGEWILSQSAASREACLKGGKEKRMRAALFTTGPYMEMAIAGGTPMAPTVKEDGIVTWRVPLGPNGAVPHVSLEDCGYYVRWLFDHSHLADGMDLAVAIEHVNYADLAHAFERVTGHKARFEDVDMDTYWKDGPMARIADRGSGYNSDRNDPAFMTVRENFTGFWTMWRHSGSNHGAVRRDYALLDEIHPHRIRSVEEWFRKEDEAGRKAGKGSLWERVQTANLKPILKLHEDGAKGRL